VLLKRPLSLTQFILWGGEFFHFDSASIPIFASASIGHVLAHGLLRRRLRLLQICGARIVKMKKFTARQYISGGKFN
jgi:hypothetical protein